MFEKTKHIKHFLFSQYLADGIRITLEIIIPAIVGAQFRNLETGITLSLGALCVSISDAPGPVKHKRNGMLYANIFIFLMALLTGLVNDDILLLGVLIVFSSFFFSMLSVYGNRAASIGTSALLVMILRMTHGSDIFHTIIDSFLILGGGVWYMLLALLFYRLTPYRPAQRSLGECIHETANYLRIKSGLYDIRKDPEAEYKKLVVQQVVVNEKQEEVRELLFKNRELLKESIRSGRLLVLTFVDLVDLYEHILASWYDYSSLRGKFASTGILEEFSMVLKNIADELDSIGFSIQSNFAYKKKYDFAPELNRLDLKIDEDGEKHKDVLILKEIMTNVRDTVLRTEGLSNYFEGDFTNREMRSSRYYSRFVSHQKIDGIVFRNNLTMKSSIFRHSLRMMITCMAGYIIGKFLPEGHHSYWILLTIIVILKPGFSLTRQRNFERFTGTIAGGIIGFVLLAFVHDRTILFALIIFFMLGTYTFLRLNYIVMVIFLTPYILILFNVLGMPFVNVAEERLLDTGIGSLLSFMASYLLFPNWEIDQIESHMSKVLKANMNYLSVALDSLSGKKSSMLNYKLIRKEVFLSVANLAGAFNRMLSEPKKKQRMRNEIYEFVVLNNVLSSNIAALVPGILANKNDRNQKSVRYFIELSIRHLRESISKLDQTYLLADEKNDNAVFSQDEKEQEENSLTEQLDFVHTLTKKIKKVTAEITR